MITWRRIGEFGSWGDPSLALRVMMLIMDDYPIRTDATSTMGDPIAYFITWVTYGTWLPGDQRGWVEYRRGWQLPQPPLELVCASRMTEDACQLSQDDRRIVVDQNHRDMSSPRLEAACG